MNAAACRDVAFDTVIMVKQTPRRMLAAVQEVCGGSVLVPDETAREAAKVYVRVAAGQAAARDAVEGDGSVGRGLE